MVGWYFLLWLVTGQSMDGPFKNQTDCVAALEARLAKAPHEFGYPVPSGICVQGVLRSKGQ